MNTALATSLRTILLGDSTLNGYGIVTPKMVQAPIDVDLKDITVTPPYLVFTISLGPTSEGLPVEIAELVISSVVSGKTDKPLDTSNNIMQRVDEILDRRPESLTGQSCYFLIKSGGAQGHNEELGFFITTRTYTMYIRRTHLDDIR